ncbi:MerR family transcriptional regulator [Demequina sp. SYSU T00039]|uniref:MerR family transcriptional regulator n=1 Tax=Demequina lignilytica TaxID=3051663 RepID=A0AAW7M9F2_9MICO|nr:MULTISPECIES: MerR family transcriptional regulator [unclassified Demequina]MDN4479199.1 MerR family transcriptional regulator [Demequina sp. SYSU T00039-1]MDN4487942.1 MerR family transcriptional regulator [Demequina sp. SYSU T00039]MDN4491748.1 MerR family transcriptional regulator [Demequina sp. SYSU T00068]
MEQPDVDEPVFLISAAAELAGMHAQTLRQYDRLGLVVPRRRPGGGRRYSLRDVATLREVQRMSQDEGINLAGIARILSLTKRVTQLEHEVERLRPRADVGSRIFTTGPTGNVVIVERGRRARRDEGRAIVLWAGLPSEDEQTDG